MREEKDDGRDLIALLCLLSVAIVAATVAMWFGWKTTLAVAAVLFLLVTLMLGWRRS